MFVKHLGAGVYDFLGDLDSLVNSTNALSEVTLIEAWDLTRQLQ